MKMETLFNEKEGVVFTTYEIEGGKIIARSEGKLVLYILKKGG